MTERRRFARLRADARPSDNGTFGLPSDGLCLNTFVIVHPPASPDTVLLGRVQPTADWTRLGALGPDRLARIGERWLLPSSQLLFFESPRDTAERVVREQLESRPLELRGPEVFSEEYQRADQPPDSDPHWDIHFIYRAEWTYLAAPRSSAFKELSFVKPRNLSRADFGRMHDEILSLLGLAPGGRASPVSATSAAQTRRP